MNGVPEEVIRVWVRNKSTAESAVPVVAFGCRCGNRWEPSNVERALLLNSLQSSFFSAASG